MARQLTTIPLFGSACRLFELTQRSVCKIDPRHRHMFYEIVEWLVQLSVSTALVIFEWPVWIPWVVGILYYWILVALLCFALDLPANWAFQKFGLYVVLLTIVSLWISPVSPSNELVYYRTISKVVIDCRMFVPGIS